MTGRQDSGEEARADITREVIGKGARGEATKVEVRMTTWLGHLGGRGRQSLPGIETPGREGSAKGRRSSLFIVR